MKFKHRPTIGLALSGGSARGFAHIGAIKVLERAGIPIDMIAGTSMGSLVAAYFAAGKSIVEMERIATSLDKKQLLRFVDLTHAGGIIAGEKVYAFFESHIKGVTFDGCKIPLRIVATDLRTGEPVVFSDGELVPAIRASIALPIIFKPAMDRDRLLVDGGLSVPLPARLLRTLGADVVIAVNVLAQVPEELKSDSGLFSIADASISIMMRNLAKDDANDSDVLINPDVGLSVSHQFDQARKFIDAGETATQSQIAKIRAVIESRKSIIMRLASGIGL